MTLDELFLRQAILQQSIKVLSEQIGDTSSLDFYQNQLADIESQIHARKRSRIISRLVPSAMQTSKSPTILDADR